MRDHYSRRGCISLARLDRRRSAWCHNIIRDHPSRPHSRCPVSQDSTRDILMTANCQSSSHRSTTLSQGEIEEPRDSKERWHCPPRAKRVSPPHTYGLALPSIPCEATWPFGNVRAPAFGRRIPGGGQGRWSREQLPSGGLFAPSWASVACRAQGRPGSA